MPRVSLFTKASKEGGLAYILAQVKEDGTKAIIQCGSTSLTDAKTRNSITEIELLAVVWGLFKCPFYTKGSPHVSVFSAHAAPASLHKKELIKVDNMRLVTMLERLGDYSYDIQHLPEAKNAAANYLSRHTVSEEQDPEFQKGKMSVKVRTVRSPPEDASLWKVAEATSSCPNGLKIIEAIRAGEDVRKLPHKHPGKALSEFWNEVSISWAKALHTKEHQAQAVEGFARGTCMLRQNVGNSERHLGVACNKE